MSASAFGWLQIALYVVVLFALTKPLGAYMAGVFEGETTFLAWIERPIYRLCGVDPAVGQDWKQYTVGMLLFSLVGFAAWRWGKATGRPRSKWLGVALIYLSR